MDNVHLQPKVSVIIPTHNSGARIERCLNSILRQDYPNLEVIIVDDFSTDDTISKVSKYPVKFISKSKNFGVAHSRNIGVQNVDSEMIVFLDSDIVVPSNGVSLLIKTMVERPDILAVAGVYSEHTQGLDFISDFKNMDLAYRASFDADNLKYLGCFFFAIKKSTFLAAGGFSTHFSGATVEDIEFCYRVAKGKKLMFADKSIRVEHLKRYNLFSMLKTDCHRIANMMMIIKSSKGKYKAGEETSLESIINLFLPGLILLSIVTFIKFKLRWLTFLLMLSFIINNLGFLHFLIKKKGMVFAAKSLFVLFIEYIVVEFSILVSFFTPLPKHFRVENVAEANVKD